MAALGAVPKISTTVWRAINNYFPSYEAAWKASISELQKASVPESFILELTEFRKMYSPVDIWEKLERNSIEIISVMDDGYPELLKEIHNPPFLLYIKGKLTKADENAIAIVGSRRCTDYGKSAALDTASKLAESGITIISGLAFGIDTQSHKGALKAGGRTIAVLGNGLDQVYPAENFDLAQQIIKNGAIISEQPIGMPGLIQNFPARNRIISGLSKGVLIVEAGEKSGTIHTANFALEQNRQLYAIPGPIYNPLSTGPNNLLKMGAKAVTTPNDILEDLGIEEVSKSNLPENDDEKLIFDILKSGPKHVDEIAKKAEEPVSEISQLLSLMEINSKVKHLGGMVYALK